MSTNLKNDNQSLYVPFLPLSLNSRAGGTSLFLALLNYTNRTGLGFARCMHVVSPERCVAWSGGPQVSEAPARAAHVLAGHMPLALDARVLGNITRRHVVLTILREPVARLVSFYNFKRPPVDFPTWYFAIARNQSCNLQTAYLAGALAGPETVWNGDCSQITPLHLLRAQHRAATAVTLLGVHHRYAEAIATAACFLSLDAPARERLVSSHVAPHRQAEAPEGYRFVRLEDLSPFLVEKVR